MLGQNTRAAKLFEVTVGTNEKGFDRVMWKKIESRRTWATLGAGCYLLRTNVREWSDEELWKAYIQLTEAAFRIHKFDLCLRLMDVVLPIRHGPDLRRRCIARPSPAS